MAWSSSLEAPKWYGGESLFDLSLKKCKPASLCDANCWSMPLMTHAPHGHLFTRARQIVVRGIFISGILRSADKRPEYLSYGISCRSSFRKNLTNAAKFWFPRQSLNRTGTGFFRRRRKSFGLAKVPDSAETWRHFGCFLVMAGAIKLRRTCKSGKVTSCYDLPPFR